MSEIVHYKRLFFAIANRQTAKNAKTLFFCTKIVTHNKCYVANMRLLTKQTTSAASGTFYHCREAHGN